MADDDDECRVCRGEAEEPDRPLFKPCKCSGSIGLVHQDCLQYWLDVQRGDGRCELCKVPFRFQPQYAPDAPARLSNVQVVTSLLRRCVARWLPFCVRSVFTASLWLVVAPLVSAYLYQLYMHYRPSVVLERLASRDVIQADLISGLVIVACIIFSFLAIMSFADFLRVEWQQHHHHNNPQPRQGRRRAAAALAANEEAPAENDIDNRIIEYEEDMQRRDGSESENSDWSLENGAAARRNNRLNSALGSSDTSSYEDIVDDDDSSDDDDDDDMPALDEVDHMLAHAQIQRHEPERGAPAADGAGRDNNAGGIADAGARRLDGFADDDDPIDMDINIALDELLGVRGPLAVVVRNLMWLLAFNAVYMGIFLFTPRIVGQTMSSLIFNTTLSGGLGKNFTTSSVLNATEEPTSFLGRVEAQSARLNTTFRLPDVYAIVLGYLFCAVSILMTKIFWILAQRYRRWRRDERNNRRHPPRHARQHDVDRLHEELDNVLRINLNRNAPPGEQQADDVIDFSLAIGVALDAMTAIVKVGLLLFLKMGLLPIFLGILLDLVTLPVFGATFDDRINHAGCDLFSWVLLHWVVGITFMLIVTVSLLQLREVLHPAVLAQHIRPQEPQPDLLVNLLNEPVVKHLYRILVSVVVYSLLLYLHVGLPAKVLLAYTDPEGDPLVSLRFNYFFPAQLQAPLELLLTHLCMLGLLERFKNSLGELQHRWFRLTCRVLKFTDALMPQRIASFECVGIFTVYKDGAVDSLWYDLANMKSELHREDTINGRLSSLEPTPETLVVTGETLESGRRVLAQDSRGYIRLPGRSLRNRSTLLPTKAGRYRLQSTRFDFSDEPGIQVWREVTGVPIPRPPEGWDDLGGGGAEEQGRWAWDQEKKSTIEQGVARRIPLFRRDVGMFVRLSLLIRVAILIVAGWATTTVIFLAAIVVPLACGRGLAWIFRVPIESIHDPFAFAIGCIVVIRTLRLLHRVAASMDTSVVNAILVWCSRFHPPPWKKAIIMQLWLVTTVLLMPLALGILYDVTIAMESFLAGKYQLSPAMLCRAWLAGIVAFSVWAAGCIAGVLTLPFWLQLFGRQLNVNDNPGDVRAEAWHSVCGSRRLKWQGPHGRVARARDCLSAVLVNFEWDKIDRVVLFDDLALPIWTDVAVSVLVPVAVFYATVYMLSPDAITLARVTRLAVIAVNVIQTVLAWSNQFGSWFETAHRVARDDRYLVGEVLMNYAD